MRSLVDTIFGPVLLWLDQIIARIQLLSVPMGQPLNISNYLGNFVFLGPHWMQFIVTLCGLSFVYLLTYLIVANIGLIQKFKNLIQWW